MELTVNNNNKYLVDIKTYETKFIVTVFFSFFLISIEDLHNAKLNNKNKLRQYE